MKIEPPLIFETIHERNFTPIKTKSRFVNPKFQSFVKDEIERLLDSQIIEPSVSPWRAQIHIVQKPKLRLVVDYSETINQFTSVDAYPFPNVESIINSAAENSVFSKIDLKAAYHQVLLQKQDQPLTAFEACGRLYQFTRRPFGITNAVPAFQRIIDTIIKEANLKITIAYLDGVLICGASQEDHDKNLSAFFNAVEKRNIILNREKCSFSLRKINILGYEISNGTKSPCPDRLKPLMDYPDPTNTSEL